MFRPWITVVLPDDWTAGAARAALAVFTFVLLLWGLAGRMPQPLLDVLGGNAYLVRGGVLVLILAALIQLRALVYALLPGSPVLWGRRVFLRVRGRRQSIRVDEIEELLVDLRPDPTGEIFVLLMRDGSERDLCPVRWDGAERLYAALERLVRRTRRRARRAERRVERRMARQAARPQ